MFSNTLLTAGLLFVLILTVGQLLVKRRNPANRILFILFLVCSIWIMHAILYRYGMLNRFPHFNKVYLPLLCITGYLWYLYVRNLHSGTTGESNNLRHSVLPIICIILSIPFYLQDADYKREYIETNIKDIPTATMYAATRLAEFTLIAYFVKTLVFLYNATNKSWSRMLIGATGLLTSLTLLALVATTVRLIGSVIGNSTISVLIPCLLTLSVFISMHLLSYRVPAVLGLGNKTRKIRVTQNQTQTLDLYRDEIEKNKWFLNPDLKVIDLARKLCTPVNELSALINDCAQQNFNEFINELRIAHAQKTLLSDPDKSILDVAYSSGFNSKSVFYHCFSKTTGMTPARFRKTSTGDLNKDM